MIERREGRTVRKLLRDRVTLVGLLLLCFVGLSAVAAPFIAPHDPLEIVMDQRLRSPSWTYPLGTDTFGRDVLSRILFGGRISLAVGLIATGIGVGIGLPIGLTAGYLGGLTDAIMMRVMDFGLAFPGIILAMVIIAMFGPSIPNLTIAVGINQIPAFARLVRGSVLSAKEDDYVVAARSIGCRAPRIMFRHIVPNVLAATVVLASLSTGAAIMAGAGLSFLGLGAQPPIPEWGIMLSSGRAYMASAWWLTVFPGLAIVAVVLAVNMVGDGLRVALDPRIR